jgi:thioredoxin 1
MVERSWESTGLEVLRTNDFESHQLKREGTYVVCFGATWCRPTRRFVPKFVALNGSLPAKFAMADITEWGDPLWNSFGIKITPTIVAFRDGREIGRIDGRRFAGIRDSELDQLNAIVGGPVGFSNAVAGTPPHS